MGPSLSSFPCLMDLPPNPFSISQPKSLSYDTLHLQEAVCFEKFFQW